MKYEKWLREHLEKNVFELIQLRIMSNGNDLIGGYPLKYGLCFVEEDKDVLTLQKNAGIHSLVGGGFIPTAEMIFYVIPTKMGYFVKRQHGDEFNDKKTLGFSLSLKGADKIAYREAQKTGTSLSEKFGFAWKDYTRRDLVELSKSEINLESRVFDYKMRINI